MLWEQNEIILSVGFSVHFVFFDGGEYEESVSRALADSCSYVRLGLESKFWGWGYRGLTLSHSMKYEFL